MIKVGQDIKELGLDKIKKSANLNHAMASLELAKAQSNVSAIK